MIGSRLLVLGIRLGCDFVPFFAYDWSEILELSGEGGGLYCHESLKKPTKPLWRREPRRVTHGGKGIFFFDFDN